MKGRTNHSVSFVLLKLLRKYDARSSFSSHAGVMMARSLHPFRCWISSFLSDCFLIK